MPLLLTRRFKLPFLADFGSCLIAEVASGDPTRVVSHVTPPLDTHVGTPCLIQTGGLYRRSCIVSTCTVLSKLSRDYRHAEHLSRETHHPLVSLLKSQPYLVRAAASPTTVRESEASVVHSIAYQAEIAVLEDTSPWIESSTAAIGNEGFFLYSVVTSHRLGPHPARAGHDDRSLLLREQRKPQGRESCHLKPHGTHVIPPTEIVCAYWPLLFLSPRTQSALRRPSASGELGEQGSSRSPPRNPARVDRAACPDQRGHRTRKRTRIAACLWHTTGCTKLLCLGSRVGPPHRFRLDGGRRAPTRAVSTNPASITR